MSVAIEQFADFRASIYNTFTFRADATIDLLDAIASNMSASSPVQLSLNPFFSRQYSSIHDAVANFSLAGDPDNAEVERRAQKLARMRIISEQCPKPFQRNFYLFGIDTTGQPRPFAVTLEDRGYQYHPNPTPGNKPITVGHSYSIFAALPEKEGVTSSPWILPFLTERVPTNKKATSIGATQVSGVLKDENLPFANHLSAIVGDSHYSACDFLDQMAGNKNLVSIVRVRSNRTFYGMPMSSASDKGKGHPVWYGKAFKLNAPNSQTEPDATETIPFIFRNGREGQVTINAWYDMLMRGKHDIPMHKRPFTLICIKIKDNDGKDVFKRPLWLINIGDRRCEISLADAYHAYAQRYDLEHFFRFGKNRLLMASYQTPKVENEENWWEIVGLAYAELYTAASLAKNLTFPWERWLPEYKKSDSGELPSPSMVQRNLPRIIHTFGKRAELPKPRGKSPGRKKGESPGKRPSLPVIKKGKVCRKQAEKSA